ncbi:MAG: hypothetical protein P8Y97_21455 [Candidatus Lokiarchaeota archaeon]
MANELHNINNYPEIQKSIYLIEAIWIIERKSGICIFDKSYKEQEKSGITGDLICGFFSAFVDISEEFFNQQVEFIKLHDSRLYFTFLKNVIFVIKFEEGLLLEEEIEDIIFGISLEFITEFPDVLSNWNGNLHKFETFSKILNEIVGIHPAYVYFN